MQQRHSGTNNTTNSHAPRNAPDRNEALRAGRAPRCGASSAGGSSRGPAPSGHRRRMRYIPALDGIRALAVAAVILYHLHLPGAQGGLLGVTVFFVLSGYLITRLLVAEFDQSRTINLLEFWKRRVRRLVPAGLTVVVVTAVLCTIFNHVMLTKMRPDIIPSVFFVNNWWQIARNVSYFDALGDPSPLTHFWSLAIEEQFYLVWPPVLLLLLHAGLGHRIIRRIALVLALLSAGAMFAMYDPAADPSRLYYGTDTRAFSILLGAWLAFIPESSLTPRALLRVTGLSRLLPASLANEADNARMTDAELAAVDGASPSSYQTIVQTQARQQTHRRRGDGPVWQIDLIGAAGLAGLVLMCLFTNGYTAFQYRGGTLLASVLTLMVIAAAVQRRGVLSRILGVKPLVWLGQRSYSIYLWHYPLLLLMNPVADVTETPWWMLVIQVAVVVGVAELSYRFIETPFRQGAFGRFLSSLQHGGLDLPRAWRNDPVRFSVVAVLLAVALGGITFVPDTSALSAEGAAALANDASTGASGSTSSNATASAGSQQDGAIDQGDGDAASGGSTGTGSSEFPENSYDVLMVGDSVSLRAVPNFESTFPHGHIDAAKNRQFTEGEATYESYVQQNLAGKIAVFALGTNGLVTDDMIDSLMKDVGDRRIAVFITTRSPQPWVAQTNDAINRAKDRYQNVRVIDWYGYSADRNDLFDGDGTHLSSTGAEEYIQLVYKAVADDLPAHPEDHASDPVPSAVLSALDGIEQGIGGLSLSVARS